MAGFVFFDTETTGLRPGWDQIIHFAAIRTDHELNELDRFEVKSRLDPHVLPHPKALLTTGLPIEALLSPERDSNYNMICAVARKLAQWSPAIFVGYNSLDFDEKMLHHAFFQCLHYPYLTSRPGNGRADALALAVAGYALAPSCVSTLLGETGRPSFKLVDIASANNLPHLRAHEAMSDVEATLALCRMVRDRADATWQRFQRFSTRSHVAQFVEEQDGFVLTEFFAGGQATHRPVGLVGQVPDNRNGRFCLDLSVDIDALAAMSDDELHRELCRTGTPLRRLAVNAAPALTALWDAPEDFLGGLEIDDLEARARRLADDPALRGRLIAIYTKSWSERPSSPHPEEQLYGGEFTSDDDWVRAADFHEAPRSQRRRIVTSFADSRLQFFGHRLIHSEHRGVLSEAERFEADLALADKLIEERAGPLTLSGAIAAVDGLIAENAADPAGILPGYRRWLVERTERVQAFRKSARERASSASAAS